VQRSRRRNDGHHRARILSNANAAQNRICAAARPFSGLLNRHNFRSELLDVTSVARARRYAVPNIKLRARVEALTPPSRGETLSDRFAFSLLLRLSAITRPRRHSRVGTPHFRPPHPTPTPVVSGRASSPLIPITAIPSRRDARQSRRAARSARCIYSARIEITGFPDRDIIIRHKAICRDARIVGCLCIGWASLPVTYNLLKRRNLRGARRCARAIVLPCPRRSRRRGGNFY